MASVATWIPFIRASAIGWIPIARQPIQPMPRNVRNAILMSTASATTASTSASSTSGDDQGPSIPTSLVNDGRIRINVGGRLFITYSQTLARFPETLLGSDEREYFYDADTGEYFFDRDPMLFGRVLAYYRTGHVHWPRTECVAAFNEELAFFGIRAGEAVDECCMVRNICCGMLGNYFWTIVICIIW